ncbi:hypothetical protein ACFLTE_03330 [Bacteroidota bacterium]
MGNNIKAVFFEIRKFNLFILLIIVINSCEKNKDTIDTIDQNCPEIYGDWILYESGGGWTGGYQASFDEMRIHNEDEFVLFSNNNELSLGIIGMSLKDNGELVIDFKPSLYIPNADKYLTFNGLDTMILQDRCLDCNGYKLFRK